jgi:hypothetical protein
MRGESQSLQQPFGTLVPNHATSWSQKRRYTIDLVLPRNSGLAINVDTDHPKS